MDRKKIEKIQKLHNEIRNFQDCYTGNELWGAREEAVSAETLIAFLIENPHFQQIADNIKKADV